MSSRQLEDMQEEKRDREIAEQLGISYEELGETSFNIEEHVGNDDFSYRYFIRFDESSSKEVLDKIVGLQDFCVNVDFDSEPDEADFDPYDNGDELLSDEERKIGDQLLPYLAEEARRKRDEEK